MRTSLHAPTATPTSATAAISAATIAAVPCTTLSTDASASHADLICVELMINQNGQKIKQFVRVCIMNRPGRRFVQQTTTVEKGTMSGRGAKGRRRGWNTRWQRASGRRMRENGDCETVREREATRDLRVVRASFALLGCSRCCRTLRVCRGCRPCRCSSRRRSSSSGSSRCCLCCRCCRCRFLFVLFASQLLHERQSLPMRLAHAMQSSLASRAHLQSRGRAEIGGRCSRRAARSSHWCSRTRCTIRQCETGDAHLPLLLQVQR